MRIFLFLIIVLFFGNCGNTDKTTKDVATQVTTVVDNLLPGIPSEVLINLYENCNYIDFIFSSLPFSISQEDKSSIQQTLKHINQNPPAKIDRSCTYFAQQIFQIDGEIVMDAKIFFLPQCTYYIFYENGEEKYSASFTAEGIQFYNSIIAQAKETSNNG